MSAQVGGLRMLYSSNAPWAASGYGVQGKSLLPRLAEQPQFGGRENIGIFAWYGLQGGVWEWDGFRIYPVGVDGYGNDVIQAHTRDFGANIVVSLIDVWVMYDTAQKVRPALWCPWLPIDHDPVPDKVLESLQGAYMPLTYSRWGHQLLSDAGVKNHYIPHGIETDVYRVIENQDAIRRFRSAQFGAPEHLTVMVAANKGFPDRKAFQVQLRAWARFAKDKPTARLYIHTEPTTMYGGIDMYRLCTELGIQRDVILPERYEYFKGFSPEYMALMYNSADVYLGAAMAEGFGIPLIEAQACGTPVITTDFSSMPELVRWGRKIQPIDRVWTPLNSWQAWPDVDGIYDALQELYAEWEEDGGQWALEKRQRASQAIHSEYSWDSIVENDWEPLLDRLARVAPPTEPRHRADLRQYFVSTPKSLNGTTPEIEQVAIRAEPTHKLGVTRVEAE